MADLTASDSEPEEVLLLIEVADTAIAYDRVEKLPRYAAAHIPEVWLVDLGTQTVEQYTHPLHDTYMQRQNVSFGAEISATRMPMLHLSADDIFA